MKWEDSILQRLEWGKEISKREEKESIANQIARLVKNEDIIGIGSGSTSYLALIHIAKRVKEEQLKIKVIPTSMEIKMMCSQLGMPITHLLESKPDWSFDGTDEIDPHSNLIKGRGGAMFKEKLMMKASPKSYILADSSKMVEKLGSKFPVPIEIFPEALTIVEQELQKLKPHDIQLRMAEGKDGPIYTENGNLILDVRFDNIPNNMELLLKAITGVIESGLFIGYPVEVILP